MTTPAASPPGSILVTGTSRGIGRELAKTFLEREWRVFGCSRRAADLEDARYTHFELDVADERAVVTMFTAIRRSGAPLYALLNNAGAASMNHALVTPLATMEKLWRVNVLGTMLCCREAAKQMMPHKLGRIVNFGTVAVHYALEGEAVYVATKAAVEAYTRVLARELGDCGITANTISPSPVRTDLIAGVPAEKLTALVNRQAIKRFGEFRDVLQVIDFLLAPGSDFLTGQTLYLGGP
ncbi:MAG: SDR family NAD(P)-dependent oxidoreductase [Candidatus Binatia bacterium]